MTSLADVIVTDDLSNPGNPDTARAALTEAVTDPTPAESTAATQQPQADPDADLPTKFRGKSLKDVVEMYQNLESINGRMANDLGQQRVLTDRILQLDQKRFDDLKKNTPPGGGASKPTPVTTNDILDRPQETLERVTDARAQAAVEPLNERLTRLEAALTKVEFAGKHGDYQQVVNSPEFIEWVKASPLRLRAAQFANQGNWTAADDLLTEFKQSGKSTSSSGSADKQQGEQQDDSKNLDAARKASLETSGNAGGKNGTDGKQKAKQYRRVDLMRFRMTDPDAYYDDAFQAEILLAHHEGRVK